MTNSELPFLIILGPKKNVGGGGAVFEHRERREADEVGDLNPHRPWEARLLRQPHSEPGAFVVALADELPVVIPVAHDPSHLVLEHLVAGSCSKGEAA